MSRVATTQSQINRRNDRGSHGRLIARGVSVRSINVQGGGNTKVPRISINEVSIS